MRSHRDSTAWRAAIVDRLRPLQLSPAREAEIVEEMLGHLDERVGELVRAGESEPRAVATALEELDQRDVLAERLRGIEQRTPPNPPVFGGRGVAAPASRGRTSLSLSAIWQDLAYAVRTVQRQPGFAGTAIGMLAIGIAATATIFALINALLLKPLPVLRPQEVVGIYTSDFSGPRFGSTSYPDFLDWRARNTTMSAMTAFTLQPLNLTIDAASERVFAEVASANYFETTGARLALGAGFPAGADSGDGAAFVVLSHALWARRFGQDPSVIGRAILLNGKSFAVRGVTAAGFPGLVRGVAVDMWVPLAARSLLSAEGRDPLRVRENRDLFVIGRLKPGATLAEAQAQFATIASALHAAYPAAWSDRQRRPRVIAVLPEVEARLAPDLRAPVLGFFAVLMIVAGLVLVIACANIANLLLARAVSRAREIATRVALGASRARIVQQLLTEGLFLSTVAGLLSVILAALALRFIGAMQPPVPVPIQLDLALDGRVLSAVVALVVGTTLLCGLAPALTATRGRAFSALNGLVGAIEGGGRSRLRRLFVVTQVSASLFLLLMAGLFLRSLGNAAAIDPGFDSRGVVTATLDLGPAGYSEPRGRELFETVLTRVRAMPSVEAASLAESLPLGLGFSRRGVSVDGYQPQAAEDMEIASAAVSDGYLNAMRTRLLDGREFGAADTASAPPVAVVNEAFVNRFWPGQPALGKRIAFGSATEEKTWMTVVGVTSTGKYGTLGEAPTPYIYSPAAQRYEPSMTLVVRSSAEPAVIIRELRATIAGIDRTLPVTEAQTMESFIGIALLPARLAGVVLGSLGMVGLLLATAGLYGVIAYSVSIRTREIGLRLSLGASPRSVFLLVVRQGLLVTAFGCAVGLGLAGIAAQALTGFLYGMDPLDPATFAAVLGIFGVVTGAACAVPGLRAMRLDPLSALRHE